MLWGLFKAKKLSRDDHFVYSYLAHRAGSRPVVWPRREVMAEDTGYTGSSVAGIEWGAQDPAWNGRLPSSRIASRWPFRGSQNRIQVHVHKDRCFYIQENHMTSTSQSEGEPLEGEVGGSEVHLAVGSVACVWNHFLRRWTGGFAVAEVLATGYRLRRLSDDQVFRHVFSTDEVMEERREIQEPDVQGAYLDRRMADSGQ
jgi:hypothetical protein